MELLETIDRQRICFLTSHTKRETLEELIDLIARFGPACDRHHLTEQIFYREELMSTGIGLGVGLPHVRLEGITAPFMTIGIQRDGIASYESIDNEPVKIVMMIVMGKNQHKLYIELVAKIVKHLKKDGMLARLLQLSTPDDIYEFFVKEV